MRMLVMRMLVMKRYRIFLFIFCIGLFAGNFSLNIPVYASMPVPVTDQASFATWLTNTGRPLRSRYHGYTANYNTYKNYNLLTYGQPSNVRGNRYDNLSHQYAMHGYSYDEYTVTNTYFPDDTTGTSDPRKWNNIALGQDAAVSWMRLSAREKEYIENSKLFYSGNSFGGMSYKSLKLTREKCIVIAVPSWTMGFALYTSHYNSSGQIRYGTLNGNGIGGVNIDGGISLLPASSNRAYTINSEQEYVDITFNISLNVKSFTGLAKQSDISRGGIIFGVSSYEKLGAGPWSASKTIRFARVSKTPLADYTQQITQKSTIWVVSALGDLVSKDLSVSLTIVEKAKSNLKGTMSIKGAISLFDGKKTMMGYILPNNPKRFMSLEKITQRIDFDGNPLPSSVTFYQIGGKTTTVLVKKTSSSTGYAELVYKLGILPSSLTWRNIRINPPYDCLASTFIGSKRTDYVIHDIEITGDIYDMVYLQAPV